MTRHRPWGLFGGKAGGHGAFSIRHDDGTRTPLPPKASGLKLSPDAVAVIETPGAGGYGPPEERSPAAIAEDRSSQKFSARYVAEHYPHLGQRRGSAE